MRTRLVAPRSGLGLWLLGGLFASAGLSGCGDPVATSDGGARTCVAHADCDDGSSCNGVEQCLPGDPEADPSGCVVGEPLCMPTQRCDEAMGCTTVCEVEVDADGDGHDAIACGGDDCDDADSRRNPSATEVCDGEGLDEDCRPSTFGDRDLDGDGVVSSLCCNGADCGGDCNDNDRSVNGGSPEVCNGADDDCDGAVDEGLLIELFRDGDFDGVGTLGSSTLACPGAPGFAASAGDCDDTVASVRPTAPEICDSLDNDCDGVVDEQTIAVPWYVDRDGDGWGVVSAADPSLESCVPPAGRAIRPGDCNDESAAVSPEAPERCNGRDDDCNGRADYALELGDTEDDGLADARCAAETTDCDDRDPNTNGASSPELCDDRDNDCDGTVDEGADEVPWYADTDGDGRGNPADQVPSCTPIPGRVRDATDCDDTNAATRPDASDACSGQPGIDDDCDATIDEGGNPGSFFADLDGDGYGAGEPVVACFASKGLARRSGDCDDADPRVSPGALDDCAGLAGVDDDCDGRSDESPATRTYYADGDRDGYGAGAPMSGCSQPPGTVTRSGDCDDGDPGINPQVPDDCGGNAGADDDCDGRVDEASVVLTYYRDRDGDGYGDPADPTEACGAPAGFVADARDCNDGAATANPAGAEICDDRLDNDCNGALDCDEAACAASCSTVVVVSGGGQSAGVHLPFAQPLRVRVESLSGAPLQGRPVYVDSAVHIPEAGRLRTTDAAGEVTFDLRAGLGLGASPVTFSSPGATDVAVDLTSTARADGTLFSVLDGPRFNIRTEVPALAWLTAGTTDWSDIEAAADGTLYAGWNGVLHAIDPEGRVTAVAFGGTGALVDGALANAVAVDTRDLRMHYHPPSDRLLFALGARVWAVELATGLIEHVAGTTPGYSGDGGPATSAQFPEVTDMAFTSNGILWIATDAALRYVELNGTVRTAIDPPAGTGPVTIRRNIRFLAPTGDETDDIYVGAQCQFRIPLGDCVLRMRQNGSYELIAGGGGDAISESIPALDSSISRGPMVLLDNGDLAMLEPSQDRIRRITPGGAIVTLVGTRGTPGDAGDDGPAVDGRIRDAVGLTGWSEAEVVFVDGGNDAIRAIW